MPKRYTKITTKNQRRKLKVNQTYESKFIKKILSTFKNKIGDIKDEDDINEILFKLQNVKIKSLKKITRRFGFSILKRNREGFEKIISAFKAGTKDKDEKAFQVAIPSLIKEKKIYEPYMKKFNENMSLINDLPEYVSGKLKEAYEKGQGLRGTEIEEFIEKNMKSRAKLIVRTESAKINAALTETRAKSFGINAYIWSTSSDIRVRESHKMMNGSLVFWDDAPILDNMQGHAGEFPNCRCISLPVFELDDIQFPIKVAEHLNIESKYIKGSKGKYETSIKFGSLKSYTKEEFMEKFKDKFQ
jgi:SPP1 gp7 family putative phage head morphogenesis protein